MIGFVPRERTGVVVLANGAGMPLRDALFYEALDRALDLPPRDWNARFHGLFDEAFRSMAHGKTTATRERVPDAPPSRPLDAYAGAYATDGYPDVEVRREGDDLEARLVGSLDWSPLRHLHYDVFEWELTGVDVRMVVRFQTDDQGAIGSLATPIEPEVADAVFRRRPLVLPADVLAALPGTYDTPIEGLAIAVTVTGGKVYATQTGGTSSCSFIKIIFRFCQVNFHTYSIPMHPANVLQSIGVTLFCGFMQPLHGSAIISPGTTTFKIANGQKILRFRKAACGCSVEPFECLAGIRANSISFEVNHRERVLGFDISVLCSFAV